MCNPVILTFQTYIGGILARVPSWHWAVIVLISSILTVSLLLRKRTPVYGAVVLGITVFIGLLLLDTALLIRFSYVHPHATGTVLRLDPGRLFHAGYRRQIERLSNLAVFVPFGFFLSEFLSSLGRLGGWRQLGRVTLASFGLSLSIECLQLLLGVGFFEVADLVLNTLGGFVGAGVAMMGRRVVCR